MHAWSVNGALGIIMKTINFAPVALLRFNLDHAHGAIVHRPSKHFEQSIDAGFATDVEWDRKIKQATDALRNAHKQDIPCFHLIWNPLICYFL